MLEMMSTLLSYFEKIAHMSVVERMYLQLCGFVWMRFWHLNMTFAKVKQGHFETVILILHNFLVFY